MANAVMGVLQVARKWGLCCLGAFRAGGLDALQSRQQRKRLATPLSWGCWNDWLARWVNSLVSRTVTPMAGGR